MKKIIRFIMLNSNMNNFRLDDYTEKLMKNVKAQLNADEFQFYSNKEQIRECSVKLNNKTYFTTFTHVIIPDNYQFKIDVSQKDTNVMDKDLHKLKIGIKDVIIDDWGQCVWLEDQQSEYLAEKLYKKIHDVENTLRRLINNVMFYNLGGNWWENYMPTHLKKKYEARSIPYMKRARSFEGVHTNLLSVDTDDLVSILEYKTYKIKQNSIFHSYKDNPTTLEVDTKKKLLKFEYILNNLMNNGKSGEEHQLSLIKLIKGEVEVELDFWNKYFMNFFSCELREFKGKWTNFYEDRNHVAHNKLIDNKFHHKFIKSMEDLLSIISEAEDKFSRHIESEENNFLEELKNIEIEIEIDNNYQKRLAYQELIESKTGVKILVQEQVIEKIQEPIVETFEIIKDEIYYRSDIEVLFNIPSLTTNEIIFEVESRIFNQNIKVEIKPFINDSEGAISEIDLLVYLNEDLVDEFEVYYTNGKVIFDEEQSVYMPESYNEDNFEMLKEIEKFILDLVDEQMPEINEDELATFSCESCDKYSVNISIENSYGLGICLNCGHENDVGECMRCGTILDEREDAICDPCQAYIDKE